MKALASASLTLLILFSVSCGDLRSSNNNANSATNANFATRNPNDATQGTNDNVEDLRGLVRVPFEPEELIWRTYPNGANGLRLVAVIRLTPDNFKTFESQLKTTGEGKAVQVNVETWFPAELTSMGDISGDMTIQGSAYAATDFYQEPFSKGTVTIIPETDLLILDLQQ